MRELLEILDRIVRLSEEGKSAALATVVATSGSTYRRPGARLLVTESKIVGAVSAGCLEDEVIAIARKVWKTKRPQLLRFDTTEEMDAIAGTGLGCRGTIEVFVEPLTPENFGIYYYQLLLAALMQDSPCILAVVVESNIPEIPLGGYFAVAEETVHQQEGMEDWLSKELREKMGQVLGKLSPRVPTALKTYALQNGSARIYLERVAPPAKLVIFGAGYDALPLAHFANELGFRVTVVDHRRAYLTKERFPMADQLVLAHPRELNEKIHLDDQTFIVIMTHNYLHDFEIMKLALKSEAPYIGQMGPRDRTQELLAKIAKDLGPLPTEKLARLHAPIGLDLGAETPEEIALSILSEILAVKNARGAGFLKERKTPIHANEPQD